MATGEIIGQALIEVLPDTAAFAGQLQSQTDKAAQQASRSLSRGFAEGVSSGVDSLASGFSGLADRLESSRLYQGVDKVVRRVGDTLHRGVETVGLAAGTVLGASLVTGFGRLTALENAEKRLSDMGLTVGQSGKLMSALNDILTGTPFALDAGATAMTGFVSSGTGLDQVPRMMSLVTDAAAFGQAPLNEIADIFQAITRNGRVTANELNMLQIRGLPAFALLADAAGVTAEELKDMVSSGQLSAEEFFALWEQGAQGFGENGIKIAGAAQGMGDTTDGALANMRTGFTRFGARILGPFFGLFREGATGITGALTLVGDALEPLVQRLAESGAFERFAEFLRTLPDRVGPLIDKLRDLGPVLGPLAGAFAAISAAGLSTIPVIGRFIPVINPLVAVILGLIAGNDELRAAFFELLEALAPLVLELGGTLMAALTALAEVAVPLLIRGLEFLTPVIRFVSDNASFFAPVILGIVAAVKLLPGVLRAAAFAMRFLNTAFLTNPFVLIGAAIIGVVYLIWRFRDEIIGALKRAWDWIKNVGGNLITWFKELPGRIMEALRGLATTVVSFIVQWHPLAIMFRLGREWIPRIWEFLRSLPGNLLTFFKNAFLSARNGVVQGANEVLNFIRGLPRRIFDFLKGLVGNLRTLGWNVVIGFLNGIIGAAGKIIGVIRKYITDRIPNWMKKAFGIASPSKLFETYGLAVLDGFQKGLSAYPPTLADPTFNEDLDLVGLPGAGAESRVTNELLSRLLREVTKGRTVIFGEPQGRNLRRLEVGGVF